MNAHLEHYQKQARAVLSAVPWIRCLQENALNDLLRLGFPEHREEDWKYTKVDSFLEEAFSFGNETVATVPAQNGLPIEKAYRVNALSGVRSDTMALPEGVLVLPLAQAFLEQQALIEPYLNRIVRSEHGFHALNTVMLKHGVFIYVPAHVQLPHPLVLSHWQDSRSEGRCVRHLVVMEHGSYATIMEDYSGQADVCYATNTITEVSLAEEASLDHYKIQRESKSAYHIGQLAVQQAHASALTSHSFSLGGCWVRSDTAIVLQEPEARCLMNGIYAPRDGQHMDNHTRVLHAVPHCRSEQDYKGILSGHSRAVFNGQVVVEAGAQGTQAKQYNKNLLLSNQAEIDTKPQLDIYADDVVCTHGATVGQLDEDALFYLATRGIEQAEARRYLVQAFAAENLQKLANTQLADWLALLLNRNLDS